MSDLREAIEKAFDSNEEEAPETSEATDFINEEETALETASSVPDAPNEDNAETYAQRELEGREKPEADSKGAKGEENLVVPPTESAAKASKAPASWTPKAREAWQKLPQEAQAEVMKREKEINRVLQESSQARSAVTELNNVLAPYKEGLIASGVHNPIQQVGNLLAVESRLRQGNQTEKALTVANLIKSYGIDIGELDNVLSNQGYGQQQQPQQNGSNPDIERLIAERMAPVNQFLQQQNQQKQWQEQQERQQATQTVESFSQGAEFINDVRMDMADLLDMASARGQSMTIQEAYNKACAIHPEISGIMKQREEQQRLMGTQNAMQRKRTAASSISGRQSGPTSGRGNDSLRGSIEDAWDAIAGG